MKLKSAVLTSLPALLLAAGTLASVHADDQNVQTNQPESGYFTDHKQAVERGGVGNYAPQHGTGAVSYSTDTSRQQSADTGRFVDHNQAVAMGGVGNYVSPEEAKAYDTKLAEQENLRNQVAESEKNAPPVAEANPDEGVVFFDVGKSNLTNDGRSEIASLAKELKKDPSLVVEINGYSDALGTSEQNQKLSEERAKAVKDDLLGRGVALNQIRTYSFGSDDPIASNDTQAGRSVNRRAELYIENANEMTG